MPAATTIDDVIAFAATDIANVTYAGGPPPTHSLFTQMGLWIVGMFGSSPSTGIFPPSANPTGNPGQRLVTDWYAQHLMAKAAIEGTLANQGGAVGVAACANAVERVAYAVKYARLAGVISAAQQTAVVTLYNATWQPP